MVDSINSVVRDGLVAEHAMREGGMTLRLVQEMWIQLHSDQARGPFLPAGKGLGRFSLHAREREGRRAKSLGSTVPLFSARLLGLRAATHMSQCFHVVCSLMVSVLHVFSCVFVQQFVGSPRPVRAIAGLLLPLTRSTEPFFFRVYVRAPRADLLLWSTLVWCGF